MGQSLSWNNKYAIEAADEIYAHLGRPNVMIRSPGGLCIWDNRNLHNKKLYGIPICLYSISVNDEHLMHHSVNPAHYDFVHATVQVPLDLHQQKEVISLSECLDADRANNLIYARCSSLPCAIILLKLATDCLLGKRVTNQNIQDAIYMVPKCSQHYHNYIVECYHRLCKNVQSLRTAENHNDISWKAAIPNSYSVEGFTNDAWYTYNEPYASNQNEVIDAMDAQNNLFYDELKKYDAHASHSHVFPSAPGRKPVELGGLHKLKNKKETFIDFSLYPRKSENYVDLGMYQRSEGFLDNLKKKITTTIMKI